MSRVHAYVRACVRGGPLAFDVFRGAISGWVLRAQPQNVFPAPSASSHLLRRYKALMSNLSLLLAHKRALAKYYQQDFALEQTLNNKQFINRLNNQCYSCYYYYASNFFKFFSSSKVIKCFYTILPEKDFERLREMITNQSCSVNFSSKQSDQIHKVLSMTILTEIKFGKMDKIKLMIGQLSREL